MAFIQMNIMSQSLMRTVPVNVILPIDKIDFPGMPKREEKPFKTLYLLHGIFGNHMDWVTGTNILRWAEERNLAVVMPAGENGFYVDNQKAHNLYGEFIGQELVTLTRKMFPLSTKRENTFIAGLSMGGFGAIRNGLKYHSTFGYIAGLSAASIMDGIEKRTNNVPFWIEGRDYAESCFGDLNKAPESDMNPKWLARRLAETETCKPDIYLCCGTEDSLLGANRDLSRYLSDLGYHVTYEESAGGHEWDFWNTHLKKVLDWLPLETGADGINSGNVGLD